MVQCPSVCLSVSIKPVICRHALIDQAGFWQRLVHCVFKGIRISQKQGSLWNVFSNSELSRFFCFFCRGMLTFACVFSLVRPSQVCHTERPPLFTTRWRRAVRLRHSWDVSTLFAGYWATLTVTELAMSKPGGSCATRFLCGATFRLWRSKMSATVSRPI